MADGFGQQGAGQQGAGQQGAGQQGAGQQKGWRRWLGGDRREIPWIQQTAAADCGAACVAMVLGLHGKHVALRKVREAAGVGRDGADAWSMLEAGRRFGLRGRGIQLDDVAELAEMPRGSILHWRFNHFVVLDQVVEGSAKILDPALGRRRISMDELNRSFTGVALALEPDDGFEPAGPEGRSLNPFVTPLLQRMPDLGRILSVSFLLQLLALALPILTGLLVDRVVPRGDRHLLFLLTLGMASIVVFHFLSAWLRAHLLLALRTRLDAKMTMDFLGHMMDLPFAFFERRSTGDLMMRLNSTTIVREILTAGALSGLLDGVLVSLYLVLLFSTDGVMGLLVMVLGALRVLVLLATYRRVRELMSESLQVQAVCRGYQVQMLAGIESLKAMGAERFAASHWSNLFVDELNVSLARGRIEAVVEAILGALRIGSPLLILVLGGLRVLEGDLTLGTMLALVALATGFLEPLSSLVSTGLQLQLLGSYLERIRDVLETPREQELSTRRVASALVTSALSGKIEIRDVSFRYAEVSPWVVRHASLTLEPGSFVAIVGASGAGKSTLAYLIAGLYPATEGSILYDGQPLDEFDLRSLRQQLGVVPQQPYLFGTSIRANIALSDPGAEFDRVIEAAQAAQIHGEIEAMPMSYETVLADGGASISGGQRQRLALARALLGKPAVLILDEATSSLDAATELAIQSKLDHLRCTRIVIAHRLSTVVHADLILVMEEGRIVEQGRHQDLVAQGGVYSGLVHAQLRDAAST